MNYILLIGIIVILLLLGLIISRNEIISPSVIMCCMYIISISVAFANRNNWNSDISLFTIIIISTAVLVFEIGEIYAKTINSKLKKAKNCIVYKIHISQKILLIMLFILIVYDILSLKYVYHNLTNIYGANSDYILRYTRQAGERPQYLVWLSRTINVFAYFLSFSYLYNFINKDLEYLKKRKKMLYLIFVVLYLFSIALSAGRTGFIHYFSAVLIYYFILKKIKKGWKSYNNIRIILVALLGIVVFFYIFTILGNYLGKGIGRNPFEIISYYLGSSIVLFDKYLQNPIYGNDYFGQHTLYGIYNILRMLKFNIPNFDVALEARYIPDYYTNLYTALRRYIQDFGFIGMYIIQFILGLIYGYVFYKIKHNNLANKCLFLYGMFFYPIVEHAIEERALINILTLSSVYYVILSSLLFKIFYKKLESHKIMRNSKLSK